MFENLDKYCERITNSFWDEPFNAISNIAFILAAISITRFLAQTSLKPGREFWDIYALIGLLFLVGIGSFAWHLTAQVWALYVDIIPILVFISLFLMSFLYHILHWSWQKILMVILVYQAFNIGIQIIFGSELFNGSLFYLPTFVFFCVLSAVLLQTQKNLGRQYINLCILLAVALGFRTADIVACDGLPVGTHFVWHILTAFMLYKLTQSLILYRLHRVSK